MSAAATTFRIDAAQAQRWGVPQHFGRLAAVRCDGVYLLDEDGAPDLRERAPVAGPATAECVRQTLRGATC